MKKAQAWVALAGGIVVLIGAVFGGMSWAGWPPYAERHEFEALSQQVAANTEAGFLRQLENALQRNDRKEVRRLCNIIAKLYGYKAAGCP